MVSPCSAYNLFLQTKTHKIVFRDAANSNESTETEVGNLSWCRLAQLAKQLKGGSGWASGVPRKIVERC